jgi:tRNA (guanosine-2'-O-)-methyltransferase
MDELEEAMRACGEHLAEVEALLSETYEREEWRGGRRDSVEGEIVRRALDVPFLRELVRAAWTVGPEADLAAPDFEGRAWHEEESGAELRSIERGPRLEIERGAEPPAGETPPARLAAAERALAERSRSIVVVLDNLVNPRNASAVARTTEALGLQEIHFIQRQGKLELERTLTTLSHRWLDLFWHREAPPALAALRARGYRILAADFGSEALPVEELALSERVAVVLGSEQQGVSPAARAAADGFFYLPTTGFTSYLNVSVAAGVSLYALDRRMRRAGLRQPLEEQDKTALRRTWYTALARGDTARARRYLTWLDHPPRPARAGTAGGRAEATLIEAGRAVDTGRPIPPG